MKEYTLIMAFAGMYRKIVGTSTYRINDDVRF